MRLDIFCTMHQGGRSHMEDNFFLVRRGVSDYFGGVFDGHRGREASKIAAEKMPGVFFGNIKKRLSPVRSLIKSFTDISDMVKNEMIGCTAVVFFKKGKEIWVANAGDGRMVEVRKNGVVQITRDHRLKNEKEKARILKSGGLIHPPYVFRGEYGLMPTRSLGDKYFRPVGIISRPEIFRRKINGVGYVLATDGLWDNLHNEMIAEIIKGTETTQQAAELMINRHLTFSNTDNVAIIVIRPL